MREGQDMAYVIVVESTELGVESVHGPYAVEEVTRAQATIRDIPSDRSRRATIVKLTRPGPAMELDKPVTPSGQHPGEVTGDERHTGAMLDDVLRRYDDLILHEQTTLANMLDTANRTGDYGLADERREFLQEQKAEVADALVSLLRKGIIDWTEADVALSNEARTDAWRDRKQHDVTPQPITDAIRKALGEEES